jgi:hypothetical protein
MNIYNASSRAWCKRELMSRISLNWFDVMVRSLAVRVAVQLYYPGYYSLARATVWAEYSIAVVLLCADLHKTAVCR